MTRRVWDAPPDYSRAAARFFRFFWLIGQLPRKRWEQIATAVFFAGFMAWFFFVYLAGAARG